MYLAKVYVQYRPTVSDPAGPDHPRWPAPARLRQRNKRARTGKYMEITLDADSEDAAGEQVRDMCDKLLANPVIEDYRFDLEVLVS